MPEDSLEEQLAAIVARIAPETRAAANADVAWVLAAGIRTQDELLACITDAHARAEVRAAACWLLGVLAAPGAVLPLHSALHDADPRVRQAAARALGELGDVTSTRALLDALERETVGEVRCAVVYALGLLGDERALEPLLLVLRGTGEQAQTRAMAAEALADLRLARAIDPLIAALSDPEPQVRFFTVFALGEIGDERALPELLRLAEGEHADHTVVPGYSSVAEEAARAINAIRARGAAASQ